MKRRSIFYILVVLLLLCAAIVHGQGFIGPSSYNSAQPVMISRHITITEARNLPHDSFVILNGNITGTLPGGKNYTFRDNTGEIAVEIDAKHWRGLSVVPGDSVVIYGEVKIQRGHVLIKVHAITGTGRINVRQGQPVMISQPVIVMEARNLPHDSFVILNGNIVNALPGGKNYTFRDSSGEISIDISPKNWRGLTVGVSDRVEIYCEVKIQKGQVILKVHAINIF
ncbi:MAG: NirD/YgiW/YdeI family stress tolerance protein [Treponema sp.]|nr:NirD/YgiW/YdeI family stress tolerance protein [Treponema sp.]MCL2272044.1 NirD/YgiW/YdeI family stress tolerance protein [Treponema sp.]MCL2272815.1 NirD/YgiW/YdeI family stress tolerance protein [Treponema sp.]